MTADRSSSAIQCEGLTKVLGSRRVVDSVSLSVEEGEIFGFLGRNGAGKTTTIRMLMGLMRATEGSASLLGHPVPLDRAALRDIGSLVEEPALYPWMSGHRNLRVLGPADVSEADMGAALTAVDLQNDARRKVKTYSHGMRQRLGVAIAICGRPRLVILDEPANGLDPAGIRDLRETLKKLSTSGVTVFLSSHQLGEVERTCDRAAILHRGKLIAVGGMRELGAESSDVLVEVAGELHDAAVSALSSFPVSALGHGRFAVGSATGAVVGERLASVGIFPEKISTGVSTLEDRFLSLTADASEGSDNGEG